MIRTLIVDDSPEMRALLHFTLTGWSGIQVVGEAGDGIEALRLVAQECPDLVLLDIAMPRMDGLEAAREITRTVPDAKIVCLSAYSGSKMADDALEAGADAYLEKSAPSEELQTLISRLFPDVELRPVAARVALAPPSVEQAAATSADERRYALLLDALDEGVLIVGNDGLVRGANFAASRLLGVPTSSVVGCNTTQLGLDGKTEALHATFNSGRPVSNVELVVERPDGSYPRLSVSARPVGPAGTGRPEEVVLTLLDVTERANLIRTLRTLTRCNQVLVHATDETELLDEMCKTVVEVGGYRLAWVGYAEQDVALSVRPVAAAGDVGYLHGIRITWADDEHGRGPTGRSIRTGEVQVCDDMLADPRFEPWRAAATAHGFRSSIVFPLRMGKAVAGALSIYAPEPCAFDAAAVSLLEELSGDLSYGIQHQRDMRRLDRSMEATMRAIAATVEVRDPYTAGHQRRVAELATRIAMRLRRDPLEINAIRIAASIHDIGKNALPAEILSKPGRLSSEEYELVKGHVHAGYNIIADLDFPYPTAEVVLQHHERLDGSGYPRNLSGEQILVAARILAVADVVEAMAHFRPYRPALGLDAALHEISTRSGTLYDPGVVEACLEEFRDGFVFSQ